MGLNSVFRLTEVRAYDVDKKRLDLYAKEIGERLGVVVRGASSVEAAVRGADIVVTATPSNKPYLRNDWISRGMRINAFGADSYGKQELDRQIYERAELVVDDVEVSLEKKLFTKENIYCELGEVVTGKKKGREKAAEITVFDSTGLGIQDVAAASIVYEKAKKMGRGTRVSFN